LDRVEKKVLLVEDDLDLRDVVQDVLEEEGYDVIPAADGRQALEYLRVSSRNDDAPALLILDLMMPIVSGWAVLEAMRSDPSLQVPVIVVSAGAGARPNDVAAFLRKPFNLSDLLSTVHEFVRAQRSVKASEG
jgi:two-component system, chemotaxis family, chemotaxis protein CheY